jgi:fructose-1,6-bisphosphatase/inositol monophosphatase family enzyme
MNHELIKNLLCELGQAVCDHVHQSLRNSSSEALSAVYHEGADDTIYQIDRDVEEILVPRLAAYAEQVGGLVLIAEGISNSENEFVLPVGLPPGQAQVRIIIDPIDGTRGIMYDKRSAFFLAGAAVNKGAQTYLQDIEVAVMTELPTSRSFLSDTLWAIKGQGAHAFTRNLTTQEVRDRTFSPSRAQTIVGGFSQIARFFPPGRAILAQIDDELIQAIMPDMPVGKAILFEDQYISSGGQLYEVLVGHDRFIADLRPLLYNRLAREGKTIGLVCHPYDVAAHLIGLEAGIIVTNELGEPLNPVLDTTSPVGFMLFANEHIKNQVQPILQQLLVKHALLPG